MRSTRSLYATVLVAVLGVAGATAAQAEVTSAQPAGFEVVEHVHLSAPPDRAWPALGRIGEWWSPSHTFSGDARNLSLKLQAGECFCEVWAGGSVRHMIVVVAEPDRLLRLEGGLGPLGGLGTSAHLTFSLKPAGSGTDLTLTYDVGGWSKDGLDRLASPVDGVLGDQAQRLARYLESGRPGE